MAAKISAVCHAGYGDIAYRPNDTSRPDVQGAVLDLSESELARLRSIELGYAMRPVTVVGADGTTLYQAQAFVTDWWFRAFQECRPTARYIGVIRAGAEYVGLSAEYQVRRRRCRRRRCHRRRRRHVKIREGASMQGILA